MRLIPGKTKVQVELFKGVTLADLLVCGVTMIMIVFVLVSSLPGKLYIIIALGIVAALLLARMDAEPNYIYLMHILRHFGYIRHFGRLYDDEMLKARKAGNADDIAFHELFRQRVDSQETPKERKKREKAEKAQRKKEDRILKSKKASREEKDQILDRRAMAEEEAAAQAAHAQEQKGQQEADAPSKETKKEQKAREKAKKLERKQEDKLLKSKKASEEEKTAIREKRAKAAEESARKIAAAKEATLERQSVERIIAFTDIRDNFIEYGGKYYGAVLEIPAVEFRFFSQYRRDNSIEGGLGRVLRAINAEYSANIVKIERPVQYDAYLQKEYDRLDELKASFENGMLNEEEYKARVEIMYDRINEVRDLCYDNKVVEPFYYLVLFESDKRQLHNQISSAMDTLRAGEMNPRRLNTKELAVFLKYTNQLDFDEREIDSIAPEDYAQWAMPMTVDIKARTVQVNHIITHNMRLVNYPTVVGDAWLAGVMSMPGTKVVVKCRPMDRTKAIRGIDRSLQELRGQYMATGVDSRRMELQSHIETLGELLSTLQQDNESLLEVNVYVTAYDIVATRANHNIVQPPRSELPTITNMKKAVRRTYQESSFRLNNMEFDQVKAFIGTQVSGLDPMRKQSRGIPSNSLAACYPWIYAHVSDEGGIKLGSSEGVPVFIDFFRRDSERVNSNMVIVGKSGSGKSYATKSLLTNLAAEDCKIFILDPENEYTELAENLHGKFINVGNAQFGRLNPFHIITALDDDESDGSTVSGSYATHLQFLEEFFRQILPDCDKDAMEYLNSLIDRMYTNHGITGETDLSRLKPEDYPVFDDLYDAVLAEFQQTDNEYIRTILRTLMNYVAKFSTGGRNANIWNGPSTVTTDENFTVFNFQSLLANRNSTIANAQMLLVLKYIDNEIIKNRDYNTKYGLKRKVVVVIDEAHVFIDTKFPVALDFMFQLAKRIRKYNGMQIVITQNIKDFVGSEEIARKSTAIINACQYSFIFSLAPNDIQDLCKLYEKAGGINEIEQERITTAPRGQAFTIMSPTSRSTFKVEVPEDVVEMFQEKNFESRYFSDEEGGQVWEDVVRESREKHAEKTLERWKEEEMETAAIGHSRVTFVEMEEDTFVAEEAAPIAAREDACHPAPKAPEAYAERHTAPAPADELAALLGRFSYDAILREIQRSVQTEVERVTGIDPALAEKFAAAKTVAHGHSDAEEAEASAAAKPVPSPEEPVVSEAVVSFEELPVPDNIPVSGNVSPANEEPSETPANALVPESTETVEVEHMPGFEERTEEMEPADEDLAYEQEQREDEAEEQPEETFEEIDLMALLRQNAEELDVSSPIEMMEIYGEQVLEITFEELVQYNNHINRGKQIRR